MTPVLAGALAILTTATTVKPVHDEVSPSDVCKY
jgi:hypothetical protein